MGLYKATKLLLKFRKSFPDQQVQSLLQRQPQMFALFQTGLYLGNPLSCGFRIGDFTGGMMCERGGRRHGVSTSQCPAHCLEACFYVAIVQNTSFFQYTQDILDHGYVRANLKSFVQVFNDGEGLLSILQQAVKKIGIKAFVELNFRVLFIKSARWLPMAS